jgi:twitching motility protein PilT
MISLHELLERMTTNGASDLHLTAGVPPQYRIDGQIVSSEYEIVTPELSEKLAYSLMKEDQRTRFEQNKELDLSFGIKGLSRYRANVYLQRGVVTMAIRTIPYQFMTMEKLGLPKVVQDMAFRPKGLVLVTGPTGSGKSTTLAALINRINEERRCHIITIEDPIEYVHQHKKSIVNQRELNSDTHSFTAALKYVLRQDPDVIMVGEMRDLETIQAALTIAETGHLVFATLHTNSTYEAISRIVDVFPSDQQPQILAQLAFVLEGIVTQQLVPKMRGGGRVLIPEILICNPAIRAVVREGKTHQIYTLMQAGQKFGMQTMNQALFTNWLNRVISYEEAMGRSTDQKELETMIAKSGANGVMERKVS